ncbi:FAD/NAD(P)-binding protein [Rhodococcus qingshengii]|uniref:FAD/NAD(P)-binding protein n=1 Tax=Rhodococcus qingshengii TaxID=334542 RepID=UPI0024BA867A|nr:FAD/NAD(P)-binding protein [Rhodococcus qingshengii]MDJ0489770.1 FAD/NAD(P)-binding protein [Rhodococcus qingshengii]
MHANVFGDQLVPTPCKVVARRDENSDTSTLTLAAPSQWFPGFRPGQFMMVYARGVGEIPLSISGDPTHADHTVVHTVRAVGAVSRALHEASIGDIVGVRGPFGTGWDLDSAKDDLIVVAGGVGLAAVRSAVLEAQACGRFRRVVLSVGARRPTDLLYRPDLDTWSRGDLVNLELSVDVAEPDWQGHVGFVTQSLKRLVLEPGRTTVLLCGPEPMMRMSARTMIGQGVERENIRVSLERNMQCGTGVCGHCQLGELLLCRDGPVVDYRAAEPLLAVKEL